MNTKGELFQYVKVENHPEWFLLLHKNEKEPENFSEIMQEKILRSRVCQLHHDTPKTRQDFVHRLILTATRKIDYEELAKRFGSILIRSIGSYMTLGDNIIIEDVMSTYFPIDEYADIVICENDEKPEWKWLNYLKSRFPDTKIHTISYFDLLDDDEVQQYFKHAKYVTFSTTFSNFEWFKKLSRHITNQTVIGYCHDETKWEEALEIHSDVEIVAAL